MNRSIGFGVIASTLLLPLACFEGGAAEELGKGSSALVNGKNDPNYATSAYTKVLNSSDAHLGSGVYVRNNWVLTAEHVNRGLTSGRTPAAFVQREGSIKHSIVERFGHPAYAEAGPTPVRDSGYIDLALLKLDDNSSEVAPADISSFIVRSDNFPAQVTCFSHGPKSFSDVTRLPNFDTFNVLRGGELRNNTWLELEDLLSNGFMQGDSGGPCFVGTGSQLIGIMSELHPDVNVVQVANLEWINRTTHPRAITSYADFDGDGVNDQHTIVPGNSALPESDTWFLSSGETLHLWPLDIAAIIDEIGDTAQAVATGIFGSESSAFYVVDGGLFKFDFVGGVPALDLAFAPRSEDYALVEVADVDGDGFDDLIASRSVDEQHLFFGASGGISNTGFDGFSTPDIDGDGFLETMTVAFQTPAQTRSKLEWRVRGGFTNPLTDTYDTSLPAGVVAGFFRPEAGSGVPVDDVVIYAGGNLFYCRSTGFGGVSCDVTLHSALGSAPKVLGVNLIQSSSAATASLLAAPGFDGIEALLDDGSVLTFLGGDSGLRPNDNIEFVGFPTPFGGDGKFATVGGKNLQTVEDPSFSTFVGIPEGERLIVEIFDGDFEGINDREGDVETCFKLIPDQSPGEDTATDTCRLDEDDELVCDDTILAVPESEAVAQGLLDNSWWTFFDGTANHASACKDGVCWYRVRIVLSAGCTSRPSVGSSGFNAFKVRTNGAMMMGRQTLSFIGRDQAGLFASGKPLGPVVDTSYDGVFDLEFDVRVGNELTLTQMDADDLGHAKRGVANGANHEIQFEFALTDGSTACGVASDCLVDIPSGNFTGAPEDRISYGWTGVGPGSYLWRWSNVLTDNNVGVEMPAGSPLLHPVYGRASRRLPTASARELSFWQAQPLSAWLPVNLTGTRAECGLRFDEDVVSPAQASTILADTSGGALAQLRAQLLTAKLNVKRSATFGESLPAARIQSSEQLVRDLLSEAERAVVAHNTAGSASLLEHLNALNEGFVNFAAPGEQFLSGADQDTDGLTDIVDNCPVVANVDQADGDLDGLGDACEPRPVAVCRRVSSTGARQAVFGYQNPLREHRFRVGPQNRLVGALADSGQPTLLEPGGSEAAFVAPLAGSSVTWELNGDSATVNDATPLCPTWPMVHEPCCLESGTCTPGDLLTLSLTDKLTLFASNEVIIADQAMVGTSTNIEAIVSGGRTEIGANASVGDVFSGADISVRSQGRVNGTATTAGIVSTQAGAIVANRSEHASLLTPRLVWSVEFPAPAGPPVSLEPDQTRVLAPGSHGAVSVKSRAVLELRSGVYYFESLTLEPDSVLRLNQTDGPVVVHVRNSLVYRGKIAPVGGGVPNLVVDYQGSGAAIVEGAFAGALVAPNATLLLARVSAGPHRGIFAARRVELAASALVQR